MGYLTTRVSNMVLFTDAVGKTHHAIVINEFSSETYPKGSVNLVFVSDDEALTDPYGRQIVRQSSVPHQEHQSAHGMFYVDC